MSRIILNLADGRMDRRRDEFPAYALPWEDDVLTGIRIGSETCSRLLDDIRISDLARQIDQIKEINQDVWFVFPNVAETQWDQAVKLLECCVRKNVTGVVVNDYGLLMEAGTTGLKVVLGRQFDKRFRDIRQSTGWNQEQILEGMGQMTPEYQKLIAREQIYAIEAECFGAVQELPEQPRFWVHAPYILLSVGRFCEFSGIGQAQERRYQLNGCRYQCKEIQGVAHSDAFSGELFHRQNAFYMMGKKRFLAEGIHSRENVEIVYTPRWVG